MNQLVKIVHNIVQCVRVARILVRPALARVSRRSSLSIAVVRDDPWLRREIGLLSEFNSRFPNTLCESKAVQADDKEIACHISLEELIRDRSVWLGRESYGRHIAVDKCLQQIISREGLLLLCSVFSENIWGFNLPVRTKLYVLDHAVLKHSRPHKLL